METVVKTHCELCAWGCGMDAVVKGGALVSVAGTEQNPVNRGRLCEMAKSAAELLYSKDRLKFPLRKVGGKWSRISWEEAYDFAAEKLLGLREKYGARSVAFYVGYPGVSNFEMSAFTQRLRSVFGTPNMISVESMCYRSRIFARQTVFGYFPVEQPQKADCIILWGTNPDQSKPVLAKWIRDRLESGLKLIVIDCKKIPLAEKGIFLQLRPGTDLALALAMMNVIINEEMYDKSFVDEYCYGFDKLKDHVQKYTPEWAAETCGGTVSAPEIKLIARIYANTKPACLMHGINTQDQKATGAQHNRAFAILQAITGNIEKPGTWVNVPFPRFTDLRVGLGERPLGSEEYPLFDKLWNREAPYGQGMLLPGAILEGKPYPIRGLVAAGSNMAVTFPNSALIRKALKELEFFMVSDIFMTETAELAQLVLPACTFLERQGVGYVYAVNNGIPYLMLRQRVVEPLYESKPDWVMWSELGRRMGYAEYFPWQSEDELTRYLMRDCQISYEELIENPDGVMFGEIKYEQYKKKGFRTPSGKIELYSDTLEKEGFDPLPVYAEPLQSPIRTRELAKEFPFILINGARSSNYLHSQYRGVTRLRQIEPEPLAEMHQRTANDCGVVDGELVYIETNSGKIKIRVKINPTILQGVINLSHAWDRANANELTDINNRDPITGFPELKPLQCRVGRI